MLLLLLACGPKEGPPSPGFDARPLWNQLGSTTNSCPEQFDYHPKGGLLIFGCHVASVFTLQELHAASPHPIWASGPHGEELDLGNPSDFGHYDPDFVRWAGDALIPAARSPGFREATQGLYDENVAPLARIMWQTHRKLEADHYDDGFDGGVSGNVAKTAVGFWLRRELDGTADLWAANLHRLMSAYGDGLATR